MIDITLHNRIALVRLTHGKANAFDLELSVALRGAFDDLRASPAAAIVVTGQGAMFSAGVDLVRVVKGGAAYVREFLPALSAALEAVFLFPKPVVAAVNGHAIAGGCILACAADYRVMAEDAGRIGVPELRVGVPFPTVPLEILRFSVPAHLEGLVYGGATFTPDEALEQGIVDTTAEPDELIATAMAAAEQLAALPPAVFELTKRHVRGPARQRMVDWRSADREVTDVWCAPETISAIREYVARTFKKGV